MASENMGTVPINTLNSHLLFQPNSNPLSFARGSTTPCGSKPGFLDDKIYSIDQTKGGFFSPELRRGGGGYEEGRARSMPSSGDEEEEEDDEEEEEEEEDEVDDDEEEGVVMGCKSGGGILKDHASLGSSARQIVIKNGGFLQPMSDVNQVNTSENDQQGRAGLFQRMVTVAEHGGGMYYSQLLQGTEGCSQSQKDITGDNGYGFNGRKDTSVSTEPGESLRAIFSDPITGALMDDAMILPCGHSFGGGGVQHVIKTFSLWLMSISWILSRLMDILYTLGEDSKVELRLHLRNKS